MNFFSFHRANNTACQCPITMDNEAARLLMLQSLQAAGDKDRHVAFMKDCSPPRLSKARVTETLRDPSVNLGDHTKSMW